MNYNFEGKTALVTGGSRGIGKGITETLLRAKAKVFVISKTKEGLDKLKSEFPKVHTITCDLADWDATRLVVESIGPVDYLINNAGVSPPPRPFIEYDKDTVDDTISVNLKSAINVSQIVTRLMISKNIKGSIVNISSFASIHPASGFSLYCISKAALDMATKVMALELGPHKIRVNAVNPIIVMTDMGKAYFSDPEKAAPWTSRTPLGRLAEVEDVVDSVMFLLSDSAAMITGTLLPIEGGFLCS